MESSDSELGLVEAAKAQRSAGAKRTPPRPLPPATAASTAAAPQPAASSHSSDSEEGFDLIAAAKKQQRASAAVQPASLRHGRTASASPAVGGSPHMHRPTRSSPPAAAAGNSGSDSDSEGQDMVTLAWQHGRQARIVATAAAGSAAAPQRPTSGSAVGATRRELNHSISLAPGIAEVGGEASAAMAPPTAPAQQQPAPPARSQPASQQPSRTGTVVVHEGVPVPSSLLELAAGQLPQLPEAGQEGEGQAVQAPAQLGQPFAFSAGHSRQASSLQGATPHSPRASSQYAATAGSSRSPSRLATAQAGWGEGGSAAALHTHVPGGAAASPASSSPGVPLASLADLGDVLGSVVDGLKSSLSADIGRLEAGWAQRWREQADSTAELRGRLDRMAAASDGQAQEVAGRLQALQGELAQQRSRLEAVERASVAAIQPVGPCSGGDIAPTQGDEPQPASSPAPATSVQAIMRRLSLLESRAAAVAAAAVWGSTNGTDGSEASLAAGSLPGGSKPARAGWCGSPASLASSPRIRTAAPARPASAGPGYGGYGSGSMEEGLPGWRAPSSCGPSRRSRADVDAQVADTHALISGIHGQIAAIKSSPAGATGELHARRAEAASTAQRLDALERTDRCMASVESANLSSVMALERRVRELEGTVEAASTDAATGRAEVKQARAALAALEWRVDKSSDATIGTLKALEARQDKMRSELHAVAGTATLAGAKADSLMAEVARLQRRVHGSGGGGSPLSPGKAAWRLY
ncbi:hypothetical protein C2E21_7740 [Chlorella sorokiniana]|uniref:Uncharacterized protein n=1 Tax=Chlorella sorokiniana TaxID=3076 RepID=A0A2P6TGH7_CHLSO|nr:hypothetical protein C2E21_7740 [Chlorella sorokiniana]|eukprot:PRW33219.1 hypothetical protein C2E21_7740 [Chlorella sorokiniana]